LSMMSDAGAGEAAEAIVTKALRVLREYPLCDNCLGRMFALLGRGMTNAERGKALKTLIVMELHRRIRGGDNEAKILLRELAPRLRPVVDTLYRELFGEEPGAEECYICGRGLDALIDTAAREAVEKLMRSNVSSFLVAARIPPDMRSREDEIKTSLGLQYGENIGAEVKREVSKRIQQTLGLRPDFEHPDVLVEVDLASWSVRAQYLPLLIAGRYWKLARRVSQSIWVTRDWERRYPFSVEDGLALLSELLDGRDTILHGAGREDADVRMLGTGRPFIVEVKEAKRRTIKIHTMDIALNRHAYGLVEYKLASRARRSDVASVKGVDSRHSKIYKALVVVDKPVSEEGLSELERFFTRRSIKQRTPRRVRHRRPDIVRERIVFSVKTRRLGEKVFEALINAEGGLYIKELVSGDDGDTEPSFASVLGVRAYCAELDVVAVIDGERL